MHCLSALHCVDAISSQTVCAALADVCICLARLPFSILTSVSDSSSVPVTTATYDSSLPTALTSAPASVPLPFALASTSLSSSVPIPSCASASNVTTRDNNTAHISARARHPISLRAESHTPIRRSSYGGLPLLWQLAFASVAASYLRVPFALIVCAVRSAIPLTAALGRACFHLANGSHICLKQVRGVGSPVTTPRSMTYRPSLRASLAQSNYPLSRVPSLLLILFSLVAMVTCVYGGMAQPDICLSRFKSEEFVDGLRRRMSMSFYRFGNYLPQQQRCLISHVQSVYKNKGDDECISLRHMEYKVLQGLGMCIPEIKSVRTDGTSRSLVAPKPVDVSDGAIGSTMRRSGSNSKIVDGSVTEQRVKSSSPRSLPSSSSASSLPYGSPFRRVARALGLEDSVSEHYSDGRFDCGSGQHWCCVFIGDDQDFSCFQYWCPSQRPWCR